MSTESWKNEDELARATFCNMIFSQKGTYHQHFFVAAVQQVVSTMAYMLDMLVSSPGSCVWPWWLNLARAPLAPARTPKRTLQRWVLKRQIVFQENFIMGYPSVGNF